jgi:hypothetical protein
MFVNTRVRNNPMQQSIPFEKKVGELFSPFAWLKGRFGKKSLPLFDFEKVSQRLPLSWRHDAGMQTVAISQIVGTIGRSNDFDRDFRPQHDALWMRLHAVAQAIRQGVVLPPVELFRLGSLYFVVDGHHRIAVMRQQGCLYVDAHVIEVRTTVDIESTAELRQISLLDEAKR